MNLETDIMAMREIILQLQEEKADAHPIVAKKPELIERTREKERKTLEECDNNAKYSPTTFFDNRTHENGSIRVKSSVEA